MNEIDKKILNTIQMEGQISYAELGKQVGLSVSAINERLKKLKNKRIIKGWGARIDPIAIGLSVLAFVFIQVALNEKDEIYKKEISTHPEVEEFHHVTGEWSYIIKVRTKSITELEDFISLKMKPIKGILRIQTMIALSSLKEWTPMLIS